MKTQEIVDLRGVPCPTNAARALMALEMCSADEMVILIDDGEPVVNVRDSLETAGFQVIAESQEPDATWKVVVRVG